MDAMYSLPDNNSNHSPNSGSIIGGPTPHNLDGSPLKNHIEAVQREFLQMQIQIQQQNQSNASQIPGGQGQGQGSQYQSSGFGNPSQTFDIKIDQTYLGKREFTELPSSELENTKYLSPANSWLHNQICNAHIPKNIFYPIKNLIQDTGELITLLELLLTTKEVNKNVITKLLKIFKPKNLLFLSSLMVKSDSRFADFVSTEPQTAFQHQPMSSPGVSALRTDRMESYEHGFQNFAGDRFDIFERSDGASIPGAKFSPGQNYNSKLMTPVQNQNFHSNLSGKSTIRRDSINIDVTPSKPLNSLLISPNWYHLWK
jgi:hypothetical protein